MKSAFVFTCAIAGTLVASILTIEARKLDYLSENLNNPHDDDHLFCEVVKDGLQNIKGDLNLDVIKTKIDLSTSDKSEVERLIKECTVKMKTAGKMSSLGVGEITKCLALCLLSSRTLTASQSKQLF